MCGSNFLTFRPSRQTLCSVCLIRKHVVNWGTERENKKMIINVGGFSSGYETSGWIQICTILVVSFSRNRKGGQLVAGSWRTDVVALGRVRLSYLTFPLVLSLSPHYKVFFVLSDSTAPSRALKTRRPPVACVIGVAHIMFVPFQRLGYHENNSSR